MGRHTRDYDWFIVVLLFCLSGYGLFLLLTISRALFFQHILYLVVSIAILFLVSSLDTAILWWFAPIGYIVSLLLLGSSFLGPEIRGATRWIVILGVQFQPSELAKPLLLLAFSYFMSKYSPRQIGYMLLHLILLIPPVLLVFLQPDLGTSIVYAGTWLAMLIAGGSSLAFLIIAMVIVGVLTPIGWHALAAYQKSRVMTFLNPSLDPKGAGYNALQSMIAVGSGQLIGRGLGRGTQSHLRFLPEFHTDFIFATLIEELGLLGGLLLFGMYGMLLWRIIGPLLKGQIREAFPFIYSIGLFAMLLIQIGINIGMNMGIVPITGITLPFISYGGSSLLSLSIGFGFLLAMRYNRNLCLQ